MKTLIISAMLLSFSAIASELEPYLPPDDNTTHPAYSILESVGHEIVYTTDGEEVLMADYIEQANEIAPELPKYCLQKILNARVVIESRHELTAEQNIDSIMEHMVAPSHAKVDTERMIRDIYREDLSSEYDFDDPADIRGILEEEMMSCLVNKY